MKKRIEWIDLCKIITMIIVCYDHTIQSIAPDEALKNSFFIGTISFHMPLFMILSGYFINPKRMRTDKITTSCFSKFKHLMVPAFSWYIIQCCLFREIPEVKASLESYWFLSCLFFCFCILAIITKITTNNLIVFTVACIITYFTPYCYFVKINFLMPFLAIGYWLNKHNKYLTWQLVLPILMIYIILYQHWTFEDSVYITPIRFHKFSSIIPISHIAIFRFAIAVTGSLSIIYGCILITKYFKNNILIKKLIHYGKYTLCIYTIHFIFIKLIKDFFNKHLWNNDYPLILFSILISTLIVILSIEDVVDATILGLETKEAAGHAFNIGTGVSTDVLTVANTLCEKYNIKVPISISGNYRLGDIRHNYANITLARTILGYEPKWSFSDGIGEFCKWVNTQEIQADMYDASILEMKEKGLYK